MANWFDNLDNRKFIIRVMFVLVSLGLMAYLHMNNGDGQYSQLITGIVGIFVGAAVSASKELLNFQNEDKVDSLTKKVNKLERHIAEIENKHKIELKGRETEIELYKSLFTDLQQRIIGKMDL